MSKQRPADETKCINTIRCIGAALPQFGNSGHPGRQGMKRYLEYAQRSIRLAFVLLASLTNGAPMGCAPMAHCLWGKVMSFSPKDPKWIARDRFVLSNGHACALQYTMLHLLGYDLQVDDLKQFRHLGSRTPGHPECFATPGMEVSSGPLGQGVSSAVGLAIAAEYMVKRFNRPDAELFNPFVYVIVGDGCMEEGVSSEACSLAGHLRLGRLIVLYDKNKISIDGDTDMAFTEDVGRRFEAYGWQVFHIEDADHDVNGIYNAVMEGRKDLSRPTFIICKTTIAYGSVKQGSEKTHGAPLGLDDIKQLRQKWGFDPDDLLQIPAEVLAFYRQKGKDGDDARERWHQLLRRYESAYPKEYAELCDRMEGKLPAGWVNALPKFPEGAKEESTRALSGAVLNALVSVVPQIMGGSADLTVSNCTVLKGESDFQADCRTGRYLRFGVREHAMASISSGIFAFGGFRPFAATFLNFLGYCWAAVRLAALSRFGVLYIATHDSIELGEDGPTHQPIEIAAACRATPNLIFFRPGDGNEVAAGYTVWLSRPHTPLVLALCRSAIPSLKNSSVEGAKKGAYILEDFLNNGKKQLILAASGSEVHVCVEAARRLCGDFDCRVVSMPSWELFQEQSTEYQSQVLPDCPVKLYVEAASTLGCERWFSASIGMNTFGGSGPKAKVMEKYGFTPDNVCKTATKLMAMAAPS